MTLKKIQKRAKLRELALSVKGKRKTKAELIHELQLKEGNTDCYNGDVVECRELCYWDDCTCNVLEKF